jgi:hypothetical protein
MASTSADRNWRSLYGIVHHHALVRPSCCLSPRAMHHPNIFHYVRLTPPCACRSLSANYYSRPWQRLSPFEAPLSANVLNRGPPSLLSGPQTAPRAIPSALCRAHRRPARHSGLPKKVGMRFLNLPLGPDSSHAAIRASKRVRPEGHIHALWSAGVPVCTTTKVSW